MLAATLRSSTPKEWSEVCARVMLSLCVSAPVFQYVFLHVFFYVLSFLVEVSIYLILVWHVELDVPLPVNWATAACYSLVSEAQGQAQRQTWFWIINVPPCGARPPPPPSAPLHPWGQPAWLLVQGLPHKSP